MDRDLGRLVLVGTREETRFFEQFLSRGLRDRVVAHVGDIPVQKPSPVQVLEKVAPVLEAAERAHALELLAEIQNTPGVWGLDPTLEALQMGRLNVLVAPWSLEATVWRCPDDWVGGSKELADMFCQGRELHQVGLREVVVDLAEDFGTRLNSCVARRSSGC